MFIYHNQSTHNTNTMVEDTTTTTTTTTTEFDDDFVRVVEHEGGQFMEFPKEDNGSILLSTLQAQFPHAIGLKYKGRHSFKG